MSDSIFIIPVTKYIAWHDPAHGITVVSREAAIIKQREAARVPHLPRFHRYPNDAAGDNAALAAFMADRNAWTTDREDGRMGDEQDEDDRG